MINVFSVFPLSLTLNLVLDVSCNSQSEQPFDLGVLWPPSQVVPGRCEVQTP